MRNASPVSVVLRHTTTLPENHTVVFRDESSAGVRFSNQNEILIRIISYLTTKRVQIY